MSATKASNPPDDQSVIIPDSLDFRKPAPWMEELEPSLREQVVESGWRTPGKLRRMASLYADFASQMLRAANQLEIAEAGIPDRLADSYLGTAQELN